MKSFLLTSVILTSVFACFCFIAKAHEQDSIPSLYKLLESETTTDSAAAALSKMAPENTAAREYLRSRLSGLIQQNPKTTPHVWLNAVHLAGQFRVAETIPSLVRWISLFVGTTQGATLTTQENLEPFPAGKALAQIGDTAVPALAEVLNRGETRERFVACRALRIIGSSQALDALRVHLKKESDPELRQYIQKVIDGK